MYGRFCCMDVKLGQSQKWWRMAVDGSWDLVLEEEATDIMDREEK